MTESALAQTINQRIEAVKKVVNLLVQAGRADDLHDLRVLLINTMSLLKRDPGVEAAVDDLYGAARVIVKDVAAGVHPVPRNIRLLRSALARFSERVPMVAGLSEPDDSLRFRGLEAAYAVQLERTSVPSDEEKSDARSAA
jgi:hypothetical protein